MIYTLRQLNSHFIENQFDFHGIVKKKIIIMIHMGQDIFPVSCFEECLIIKVMNDLSLKIIWINIICT